MRHPDTHKGGRPLPPLGLTEQEEEVMYPEAKKSEFMEGQSNSQTQGRKAEGRKEEISLFPPTVVPVG